MRGYQTEGMKRWMRGFNNAYDKGVAAADDPAFTERHNPYKMYEHSQQWLTGFRARRAALKPEK